MKVLVTGGAGFIGSHIVQRLLHDGYRVRVLDNFSTGYRDNLPSTEIELIEGDIRHPETAFRAVAGMDVVLHQAALGSVPRSIADPLTTHEVNATGTLHLLIAARDAGVRRFVYASSSSVYGDTPLLPKVESMPPQPLSPYALSKLAGEVYCKLFHRLYGLSTISLRYFNVFGPRQDEASEYAAVIPRFAAALLEDRPLTVYGDGLQTRDFTYVANVVEANLLAINSEAAGEVCNIACGAKYSLLELAHALGEVLGKKPVINHHPSRPGDVRDSFASIEKARQLLGFQPVVQFREGISATADWFRTRVAVTN